MKNLIHRTLPYIFVFLASIHFPTDPDLGWHLKYGEYFFKHFSVLRENTFSTMMADFKWANTSWLTDLISYFVFETSGFLGLTLLGALTVTLTFLFFSKAFKLDYFEKALIFPIIAYFEIPAIQVSFRGQLISILLLGILFYILERYQENKSKLIYLVIPLFLLWANLHGQFILGLGLFFIWEILYLFSVYINNRDNLSQFLKETKLLIIVSFLTLTATLIHPFGVGVYHDAFLHFGNENLKSIAEYVPFRESTASWWNQLIIGALISVGFLFIFFNGQLKKRFPVFAILGILYGLSWIVKRYAWSFYYLAIPFLKPLVYFVRPDSKKYTFMAATVLFLIYISFTAFIKMPLNQYRDMSWETYCSYYTQCSPKAAEFIIKNNLNKKDLMTVYDFGGWLIWNYPQIKPSIDGRMHLWIDKNGYSAFSDYYGYEQNLKDINDSSYNTIFMSKTKPLYNQLINEVQKGRWQLAYNDSVSGIFIRKN